MLGIHIDAISFLIYDEDDEPRQPTLTIGYNTESHVQQVLAESNGAGFDRAVFADFVRAVRAGGCDL